MDKGQAVGWLVGCLTATSPPSLATAAPFGNAISAEFSLISTDILFMNLLNRYSYWST